MRLSVRLSVWVSVRSVGSNRLRLIDALTLRENSALSISGVVSSSLNRKYPLSSKKFASRLRNSSLIFDISASLISMSRLSIGRTVLNNALTLVPDFMTIDVVEPCVNALFIIYDVISHFIFLWVHA